MMPPRGKKAAEACDEIRDDAEAEEQLVGGDVVECGGCVVAIRVRPTYIGRELTLV